MMSKPDVVPKLCVKFRAYSDQPPGSTTNDEKVDRKEDSGKFFINFCTSSEIPPPDKDLDELAFCALDEAGKIGTFRIPIHLGHKLAKVADKSGSAAIKVDAIVNDKFFDSRVQTSELFRVHLLCVTCGVIFEKHKIWLQPEDAVWLQNRKFVGDLEECTSSFGQKVKPNADSGRPLIQEVSPAEAKTLVQQNQKKSETLAQRNKSETFSLAEQKKSVILTDQKKSETLAQRNKSETFSLAEQKKSETLAQRNDEARASVARGSSDYSSQTVVPSSGADHKMLLNPAKSVIEIQIAMPKKLRPLDLYVRCNSDHLVVKAGDEVCFDGFMPIDVQSDQISCTFDESTCILQISAPLSLK